MVKTILDPRESYELVKGKKFSIDKDNITVEHNAGMYYNIIIPVTFENGKTGVINTSGAVVRLKK